MTDLYTQEKPTEITTLNLGFYSNLLSKRAEKNFAKSERAETIKQFIEPLNASRIESGRRPYTASYIACKMSHIDLVDLKLFLKDCQRAKIFSAYWHWALDPKNAKDNTTTK